MIDINSYRSRIGLFCPKLRNNKYMTKSEYYRSFSENEDQSGKITLSILKCIFKVVLILVLLHQPATDSVPHTIAGSPYSVLGLARYCAPAIAGSGSLGGHGQYWSVGWSLVGSGMRGGSSVGYERIREENYEINTEILDHNFQARSKNGNIQKKKGILNMHLNIRSLKNKVYEVKNLLKEHTPHMLGLSECDLTRDNIDEKCLKIPGYNILFPSSWTHHGFARVVVYVKKSFKYEQILDLQDDQIQTIWIKGGYQKSKNIFFCHGYREHLTGQGTGAQQRYMNTFLGQWESATQYGSSSEPNETHVCGDMNIDVLRGRWLEADYHLVSLSRMIKSVCDMNNFHQLVQDVTRIQYNSVANTTSISCIDHIYTNARFRCSVTQDIRRIHQFQQEIFAREAIRSSISSCSWMMSNKLTGQKCIAAQTWTWLLTASLESSDIS